MHKIKYEARHSAYKNEYNPFRRVNPRRPGLRRAYPLREVTASSDDFEGPSTSVPDDSASSIGSSPSRTMSIGAMDEPDPETLSQLFNAGVHEHPAGYTSPINAVARPSWKAFGKRKRSDYGRYANDIEQEPLTGDKEIPSLVLWAFKRQVTHYLPRGLLDLPRLLTTIPLVLVPIGFVVYYLKINAIAVFFINFAAIVPSIIFQEHAVDRLQGRLTASFSGRWGDTITGILSETFSNAALLISSVLLLRSGQVGVLRASLLGAILTNLLFMTGLCFLVGGLGRLEQFFDPTLAQTIGMLLMLAVLSIIVPTAAHTMTGTSPSGIVAQSRGTAVIVLISYCLWLLFQLYTNEKLFEQEFRPARRAPRKFKAEQGYALKHLASSGAVLAAHMGGYVTSQRQLHQEPSEDGKQKSTMMPKAPETRTVNERLAKFGASVAFSVAAPSETLPELEQVLRLSRVEYLWDTRIDYLVSVTIITVTTALIALNTQFATDTIQALLNQAGLSELFVGLVIVPVLSVDPTCVIIARHDKMSVSIQLTLDRCMQTPLMVVPLIVIVAWGIGNDGMTLEFDSFPIIALFISIVIVTYVVQEGKSNWLMGALLIKVYVIIALASYYIK